MLETKSLIAFLAVAAVPARASDNSESSCPLAYVTFEHGVSHTDLDTCPESLSIQGAFCRLPLSGETVTVLAFSEENGCMIAARAYEDDGFTLSVN